MSATAELLKPCAQCGDLFTIPSRRASRWETRKFCSTACNNEAQAVVWTREEILARTSIDGDGCWLWLLSVSRTGYGRLCYRGKTHDAYRFAYEVLEGPVPSGLVLDHTCHNRDPLCPGNECKHRLCVNPDHLEPVTNAENVRRAAFSRATCPNGHLYSSENTWFPRSGGRRCRTCHRAKMRAYEQRRRAAV